MTGIGAPKLIKRYANRKLYDTKRSCYVTLDEIAQMVQTGEDVKIVDNKTKEDMTAVTLAQIIFEQEKKTNRMPLSVLRGMIQSSGEVLSDFFQRTVTSPVTNLRGEMVKTFDKVLNKKAEDGEELADEMQADIQGDAGDEAEGKSNVVREFIDASGQTIEEWQHRIDEQVHNVMATMTHLPNIGIEIKKLRDRIAELEKSVDSLEQSDPPK